MKRPDFSKYLDYAQLTEALLGLVNEYPNLAAIYSIGKTYENRDMWMVELTNKETGVSREKPAMYIDGNHHAGEVTGSAVCLYTIWYLLSNYGKDPFVTGLLDRRVFYILPRISIDGAELFLHTPYQLRSSVREYPLRDNDDGLNQEDIDGDGWILQMRYESPHGDWKVSSKDQRLMVKREPWDKEEDGPFYKVYPEGIIKNWDGGEIKAAQSKWGLDINRNYPANWEPDVVQRGAGPYPLSEPETRNVAEFLLEHKNIAGGMSYHTTMGSILRPSCTKPDAKLPPADVAIYKTIGKKGTELTSYPTISTFEDYVMDKEHPLKGVFMDWLYEHLGIITFSTELWDASVRAGNDLFDRSGQNVEANQLRLLKWNDRELAGQGFENWRKFNHPQLGEVEIGGWKSKFVLTNPPGQFLEGECHKNCLFTLYHADCLPEISVKDVSAEKLAEGLFKVKATVENKSYMPTSGCQQAVNVGRVKPVSISISASEGELCLLTGKVKEELGHLPGFIGGAGRMGWMGASSNGSQKTAEWVVKAQSGTVVILTAIAERAGTKKAEVTLN